MNKYNNKDFDKKQFEMNARVFCFALITLSFLNTFAEKLSDYFLK